VSARLRSEGVVLVPALTAVALLVYWAAHGGGYAPTTWEPSALLVLGLLVATVAGLGFDRVRPSRPVGLALGLFATYVAFSYLSILWAAAPGEALDGSNRALLFLLLFALFALLPWRAWTALATLTAFALGVGTIALVTLVRLADASQAIGLFTDGRLDAPLGYINASAALLLAETVLAIALAARRELPIVLRGVLLAFAAASLQLSVLCESRGWLLSLPIVLVLAFVLVPGRVRLALWTLPPFAGAALALPALLDVFERTDAVADDGAALGVLAEAADHAARTGLLVTGLVLLAGLALAAVDRRFDVPPRVARGANRVGAALAVAAAVVVVALGFALTDGRPDERVADYWDRSHGYEAAEPGSSRFGIVGSNRPDFWRVSLEAFGERPLAGLGQDNWGAYYLRERESNEQPRWTHSLELRLLVHTGLVGFLLFAGFLAAALAAALVERRRAGRLASVVSACALLPLVVWLVHGSVDWFWEVPALTGPALAFLGLGGALTRQLSASGVAPRVAPEAGGGPAAGPPARDARRIAAGALLASLALLAAVALTLPYLAEREVAAAGSAWHAGPEHAFERLDRAADLNPLSARPELVGGVIALELSLPQLAERRFTAALDRDGGDWFAHFGRGLALSAQGRHARARAEFERARSLDPGEPLVQEALDRVAGVRPLTPAEAFERLRRDVQRLTG
jgi:tetratricopeptide (TPR) repeat protein